MLRVMVTMKIMMMMMMMAMMPMMATTKKMMTTMMMIVIMVFKVTIKDLGTLFALGFLVGASRLRFSLIAVFRGKLCLRLQHNCFLVAFRLSSHVA